MPMPGKPIPGVATDLGLAPTLGAGLQQQVQGETEEERKKRMQAMSQSQLIGPASSLAVGSIFGGTGGRAQ
jgi:hypothetical protein